MQIRALKLQGNQQQRRGIRDFPAAQINLFGNFRFGTGYFEIQCSKSVLELAPCSITKFSNKADQQERPDAKRQSLRRQGRIQVILQDFLQYL